ncbi:MAG: hypothetical protein MSH40_06000 [Christensenella sp.]|nr:hypothetical protein [Christensenella sp.]
MAKRYYTDQERYEYCRKFKVSGQTQAQFCKDNNLARETFRDWKKAYSNLSGDFINVSTALEKDDETLMEEDVRVNMLSSQEIIKKSTHFSRFDHSLVVIEYGPSNEELNYVLIQKIEIEGVNCGKNEK